MYADCGVTNLFAMYKVICKIIIEHKNWSWEKVLPRIKEPTYLKKKQFKKILFNKQL